MTKQHFILFANEAREMRRVAKIHEMEGKKDLAENAYAQALGIEAAVIKVGKHFNPRFDEVRFRQACNPDRPNEA